MEIDCDFRAFLFLLFRIRYGSRNAGAQEVRVYRPDLPPTVSAGALLPSHQPSPGARLCGFEESLHASNRLADPSQRPGSLLADADASGLLTPSLCLSAHPRRSQATILPGDPAGSPPDALGVYPGHAAFLAQMAWPRNTDTELLGVLIWHFGEHRAQACYFRYTDR